MLIVQKFGGTSLLDPDRIRRAAQRAIEKKEQGYQVVVVVSAQGHTTDRLVEEVYAVSAAPSEREVDVCLSAGRDGPLKQSFPMRRMSMSVVLREAR